jgi:hypothetical protein
MITEISNSRDQVILHKAELSGGGIRFVCFTQSVSRIVVLLEDCSYSIQKEASWASFSQSLTPSTFAAGPILCCYKILFKL